MGLALLVIIWLITFFSTYFFVAQTWWLPHGTATAAAFIDHQFALTYVLMGIVFVLAQGALGYLVWKYRSGANNGPVEYSHGNIKLEVIKNSLAKRATEGTPLAPAFEGVKPYFVSRWRWPDRFNP